MEQRIVPMTGATAVALAVIAGVRRRFGPESRTYAFVAIWAPMAWLGTVSRFATPTLPARWYRLRPFEQANGGRIYELLGVRVAKSALRRGPLARFNPGLHLPSEPTPDRLVALERRMVDAEATHVILLVGSLAITARAATEGQWRAARWMVVWNLVMNGYPTMLQRYNRAVLYQRYPETFGDRTHPTP